MKYLPEWESIRAHQLPSWFDEAKFGIFIHWGSYSVPAWANPSCELGTVSDKEWYANDPYAEWYQNSVRIGHGPTYEHHCRVYGKDYPYENFADLWKAEKWNPDAWADLFRRAGAKYVIPATKHHEGLCLWNSAYTDYNTFQRGPKRDIVKELSASVRNAGLRFGVYYSGLLDWRFSKSAITDDYDLRHPENITYAYADYAYNQVMELIDKYQPSVLWNDIGWPYKGEQDLPYLFAHYYNAVPEGVTNNRWNDLWCDFWNREYELKEKGPTEKWECIRGLGLSFGFNQMEDDSNMIGYNELIELLVATVADNGNLLLNVGPQANGIIPEAQRQRLLWLGSWLSENGEAIYGTKPYGIPPEKISSGETVYFTRKSSNLYMIICSPAAGRCRITLRCPQNIVPEQVLSEKPCSFERCGENLTVTLDGIEASSAPVTVKCRMEP